MFLNCTFKWRLSHQLQSIRFIHKIHLGVRLCAVSREPGDSRDKDRQHFPQDIQLMQNQVRTHSDGMNSSLEKCLENWGSGKLGQREPCQDLSDKLLLLLGQTHVYYRAGKQHESGASISAVLHSNLLAMDQLWAKRTTMTGENWDQTSYLLCIFCSGSPEWQAC